MITPPCTRAALIALAVLLLTAPPALPGADTDNASQPNHGEGARDPFWPVGYTPPPPPDAEPEDAQQEAIQAQLEWPVLRLTGLTRTGDRRHLAMIENVGIVEAGETIQVEREGIVYRWRVEAITARGINVRELGARPARGDLHNAGQ